MNKKVLTTLEFDKIISRLAEKATSDSGRAYCLKTKPLSDISRIKYQLQRSDDATSRILRTQAPRFGGLYDIRPFKKRLEIGSTLSAGELLAVGKLLSITNNSIAYDASDEKSKTTDSLSEDFVSLTRIDDLHRAITSAIISEEEIADDASSALSDIRRKLHGMEGRIHDKLTEIIASDSGCLQESVIVQRGGRYCLPVRAEFKSKIKGAVHDSSASGSTLFIEPMAVLELSNEIRTLQRQEAEEIQRILAILSESVAEHIDELINNYTVLVGLDFVFAKGRLAVEMNATKPTFNEEGIIRLRSARHPLLDQKTVVPIDVTLGDGYNELIITGPNTGGKTVTLKTIGLLSLMGQSGLLIPTKDRCTLPVFSQVYADIGDEQSIEQSLSTFSSHMTNIVNILSQVKKDPEHTLVLFDELCSGTDPAEGAALAISILDMLRTAGCRCVATTHYSELKVYALSEDNVENASCEFDVETLSPTYKLLVGIPGKSNAFAISKKLGLPGDILEEAVLRMSEDSRSFEDLLIDLENNRRKIEDERATIEAERKRLTEERKTISDKLSKIDKQRAEIIAKANEKAANILQDAKDSADSAIRNINKYGAANPDMKKVEGYRANLGKKLNHTRNASVAAEKKATAPAKKIDPKSLHIGDGVHVISMNLDGTVHSLPNAKGDLVVSMGIMQSKVNISDITKLKDSNPYADAGKNTRRATGAKFNKSASISAEIKLLGMTTDEAIMELDKYLDDARLSHLSSVRVVHGKGSGALRKAVHEYLRKQPVSGYHLAEYGEGDSGVTIVEL